MNEEGWFFETFSLFDTICWYTLLNDSVKTDISFRSSVNNDFENQGCVRKTDIFSVNFFNSEERTNGLECLIIQIFEFWKASWNGSGPFSKIFMVTGNVPKHWLKGFCKMLCGTKFQSFWPGYVNFFKMVYDGVE